MSQLPPPPRRETLAPTLGQYWRSDTRLAPGRTKPKWAGRAALWLGMLSAALFFGELLATGESGAVAAFALPVSVVAFFFALIAIIAGIGRVSGFFGAVFALAGNVWFWSWLEATFG